MLRGLAVAWCVAAACPAMAQPLLPGADGTVCDFIAANAGRETVVTAERLNAGLEAPIYGKQTKPFAASLLSRTLADVDGDGDQELLDVVTTPWGEKPLLIGAREGYGELLPDTIDYYHDANWGAFGEDGAARWLNFKGVWYAVYFNHRLELAKGAVRVDNAGPRFACRFNAGYSEILDTSAFCRSASEPATRELKLLPLIASDRRYITTRLPDQEFVERDGGGIKRKQGPDTIDPESVTSVDIDGDGKPERIVQIERYGTTRCNATIQDLLPSEGRDEPDRALRNAVRMAQGEGIGSDGVAGYPTACGWRHAFVEIAGRGYLWSTRDGPGPANILARIEPNRVVTMCQSTYAPEHWIAFDLERGGELSRVLAAPK